MSTRRERNVQAGIQAQSHAGRRRVEAAVAGTPTTIALAPPPPGRDAGVSQTGISLDTADVDEDVTRYGGNVPPMFWVRDPDGNSLIVVQPLD